MRRITWFNPPYSKNIKTRIKQWFLRLIDRHFPVGSKLRKIFNRSTVKVSYSCMPSMDNIIKRHNARVRGAEHGNNSQLRRCSCRNPDHCPLNGECLASSIVYEATADTDDNPASKKYIGSTETSFKPRLENHQTSFSHERYENSKELSKHVWRLKREGKAFSIS